VGDVIPPLASIIEEDKKHEVTWATKIAKESASLLAHTELKVIQVLREGDPKHELPKAAEEWGADCIFVDSAGFSIRFERFVLGSVSAAVAARAHCSVEVVTRARRRVRMIRPLSDDKARDLLRSSHLARLACLVNGDPYVVPINYKFENNFIYCHSLPGMKIEGLRKYPRACVQVDEITSALCWKSVVAFGNYEEVVDPTQRQLIRKGLLKEFPILTPVESAVAEDVNAPEIVIFGIRIDRMTGVYEGNDQFLLIEDAADGSYDAG